MEGRYSNDGDIGWKGFEPYRLTTRHTQDLDDLVKHLDQLSKDGLVKQVIERRFCNRCEYPVEGALDESGLEYVPGYLHKKWFEPQSHPQFLLGYGTQNERKVGSKYQRMITPYELRQLIVRSGIYSNEQLSGFRFTQHELEVNARAFLERRCILKCACNSHDFVYGFIPRNWDTSSHNDYEEFWTPVDLEAHVRFLVDTEWSSYRDQVPREGVESEFVSGRPVRTGFRLRSLSSRLKRAKKSRKVNPSQNLTVVCRPQPDPSALGTGLYSVNPNLEVTLNFKFRPPKRPGKHTRRKRRVNVSPEAVERMSRKDIRTIPHKLVSKKEKYFLRKRGFYYPSVHHPGEIDRKQSVLSPASQGFTRSRKRSVRDEWYTPPETPTS